MKYALLLEYDGSAYSGWQRQHHSNSIQQEVERALSRVADEPVQVVCSGRTDAGVHASQQCVHFETSKPRDQKAWVLGVNAHLPADISISSVVPVKSDFSARYSALDRTYRYQILNRSARSALLQKRAAVIHQPLDERRMQQAAQSLVGEHDFTSFRSAGCQANHATRRIISIAVCRSSDCVVVQVTGNAFLHNMIRIIVGSLVRVGNLQEDTRWLEVLLQARDRRLAGTTAVPCGLYFMGARYPAACGIPDWQDSATGANFAGLPEVDKASGLSTSPDRENTVVSSRA